MSEGSSNMFLIRTRVGEWLADLVSRAEAGIPVTKVFKLYQEDFGEHFPMRQLGSWNPVKALESLPEYVSVACNSDTGEKYVGPPNISALLDDDHEQEKDTKEVIKNENDGGHRKPILKPHRGTFQLTFINHFQLEKSILLDYFQPQPGFVSANILSGLKRRCFVCYKTEQNALDALENLKGNDTLVELDVADDCKLEDYEDQLQQSLEEEVPEMYICMGTFQLSFTTAKFINIGDITSLFSTYGHVAEVCSNFRKIKGRARVFVKYPDKIQAITAFRNLKHQFDDLGVANCCQKDDTKTVVIPAGKDGNYSVRFKNFGPTGEIFRKHEIYQMFETFGDVTGVKTDLKGWTYVKYSKQEEAMAAYQEFSLAQNLPNFGIAEVMGDPNNTSYVKKTKFEVEENDMEIFISNFPAKIGVNKLRKIFTNFKEITFREFKVNKTKAFCFAQLPDYEEMKRAVRELHGSIHYNRNLIVRAKIQEVHERIEAELLEEMAEGREMMTNVGDEDWEAEATDNNIHYDESILKHMVNRQAETSPTESSPGPSTILPSFTKPPPTIAPSPKFPFPTITAPTIEPPTIKPSNFASSKGALPTIAPPTVAPPTIVPPTIAPPTFAAPTFAPPTIAPPTIAPPTIAPPTIVSQTIVPPSIRPTTGVPPNNQKSNLQHANPESTPTIAGVVQPHAKISFLTPPPVKPSFQSLPPPQMMMPTLQSQSPPTVTHLTSSQPLGAPDFSKPPPPLSFSQPPPAIQASSPNTWYKKPVEPYNNNTTQNMPLTKPPQRQSFICHNPGLKHEGVNTFSLPSTAPMEISGSKLSDLADIKVSVDNNLFSPETGSRKRKLECEENINPLKDDGIELVLANFAEGTSGADIFKLLDPYNVAAVNMAVNKLSPEHEFTFCFVRFHSMEQAEEAIRQVDGRPLLNSNQIVLEFA